MKTTVKAAKSKKAKKKSAGRPRFEPTAEQREQVRLMTAIGIPEEEQRLLFKNPQTGQPITAKTLRANFRQELDHGLVEANAKVIGCMYKNATTATATYPHGNPILQIFWAKCRLGWKDRVSIGLDPVPRNATGEPATEDEVKSDYEWARRIAYTLSLASAGPPPSTKSSDKKKQTA